MKKERADVVIIGGGASGLAAAIELGLSSPHLNVVILEKNEEVGRKIRATGSGRCNITNTSAEGYTEILKFFRRIGLMTKSYENGLVYPYSESAADVASLLAARARESGATMITGAEVVSASHNESGFTTAFKIKTTDGRSTIRAINSEYVILSCGGKAGPTYGTTGDGYKLARDLGHTVITPIPVLTAVECGEWSGDCKPDARMLAGTRTRGVVTLYRYGMEDLGRAKEIFEERGEIQFTKYGLSGICVFNMTRFMRYDRRAGESLSDFIVKADLFPDGDIADFLKDRRDHAFPEEKIKDVLTSVLKENIASYVIQTAYVDGMRNNDAQKPLADITDDEIAAIARAVHGLVFHPEGICGWKEAQATSGGVSTEEINQDSSESRIIPGLYITGELADRDFPCGGFNLSNAWMTGLAAARSITDKVR